MVIWFKSVEEQNTHTRERLMLSLVLSLCFPSPWRWGTVLLSWFLSWNHFHECHVFSKIYVTTAHREGVLVIDFYSTQTIRFPMIFPFSCKLVIILRLKGVDVCKRMQGEDTTATGPMEQETDNIVSLLIRIQKK